MPRLAAAFAALVLVSACTSTVTGNGSTSGSPSGTSSTSASPGGTASEPTQPPANFADCTKLVGIDSLPVPADRRGKLRFFCAKVSVPLDYAHPDGKKITLFLLKAHLDGSSPEGSLFINPGGPGVSTFTYVLGFATQFSYALFSHYDIVGFEPRGVGLSSPIRCISDSEKDAYLATSPDVTTPSGFAEAKSQARHVAQACSAKYGSDLAFYNTVETARDLDQARQAVGDAELHWLGFSYGTELGSVYAHLYPTKVGVAVLDGAVDPLTSGIQQTADQIKGFELAFDQFAGWCRQQASCSQLGDPRQAVYSLVDTARSAPIPTSTPRERRKLTVGLLLTGVLYALYSRSFWSQLGDALRSARDGDGAGLLRLADQYNERSADGTYTNSIDANLTISCNDEKPGPSDDTIRTTAALWAKQFPLFGEWDASGLFSCQQWQPNRTPPPLPTAPTPTTVLVLGNTHDPATPYQGALDLAKTMGHAEVLTWDGEGHTSYLQGSACVDQKVNAYLIDDVVPADGTTCPR